MDKVYFRHDRPRPFQNELMDDVASCIENGRIMLAHAPTGSGKTDAALSVAITHALRNDLTVFFLTPKISQHRIAMDVVRGIAGKYGLGLKAVDIIGRKNACIDDSMLQLDHDAFYQSCEKRRKKNECMFYRNAKGSGRLEEAKADALFGKMLGEYGAGRNHDELMAMAVRSGACPYEWMLRLGSMSNVIIADYLHFMIPDIRAGLLQKMKKELGRSIVIVDEAHNLGKRVREHISSTVNSYLMSRAEKELLFLKLPSRPLASPFEEWSRERLKDSGEKVVSPLGFSNFISSLGSVDDVISLLGEAGMEFIERTGRKSACMRVAGFIAEWERGGDDCVRILRRKGGFFSLSKRYLDPSRATSVLNETVSSVLMSGTLVPLEMHRDVLGLDKERTVMKAYPSPFGKDSILNIITEGITTRYSKRDEEGYRLMAGKIDLVANGTPGGTAVFFPSYAVLKEVVPLMRTEGLLVQAESMKPHEVKGLLDEFSKERGVLVGVQGGSLAEGIDYSGEQIKTAIVVGVALDEMNLETEALIDYYDGKFGKGWDYGYLFPGTVKALQAAGRGRRKESDRVAVVYMDERFKWKKYNWIFDREERTVFTPSPEKYVRSFWKEQG